MSDNEHSVRFQRTSVQIRTTLFIPQRFRRRNGADTSRRNIDTYQYHDQQDEVDDERHDSEMQPEVVHPTGHGARHPGTSLIQSLAEPVLQVEEAAYQVATVVSTTPSPIN